MGKLDLYDECVKSRKREADDLLNLGYVGTERDHATNLDSFLYKGQTGRD